MAGDKVQLVGFGAFETKERSARVGRNPKTKEEIQIPASRVPAFKAGKALKDAVAKLFVIKSETKGRHQSAVFLHYKREVVMRLDKYLKVSRLIKRRSVANEACDGERVSVNGRQVKASYQVKVGDIIEIAFGQRTLKVEVTEINENANKVSAPAMYKELE